MSTDQFHLLYPCSYSIIELFLWFRLATQSTWLRFGEDCSPCLRQEKSAMTWITEQGNVNVIINI